MFKLRIVKHYITLNTWHLSRMLKDKINNDTIKVGRHIHRDGSSDLTDFIIIKKIICMF